MEKKEEKWRNLSKKSICLLGFGLLLCGSQWGRTITYVFFKTADESKNR